MKKIIIILGTIILGVFIVKDLIIGDTGSLKSSSKLIKSNCTSEIVKILTIVDE